MSKDFGKFELLLGQMNDVVTRLSIHKSNLENHHIYLYDNFGPIEVAENSKPVNDNNGFFSRSTNQVQAMLTLMHDIEMLMAVIAEAANKDI